MQVAALLPAEYKEGGTDLRINQKEGLGGSARGRGTQGVKARQWKGDRERAGGTALKRKRRRLGLYPLLKG